MRRMEQKQLVDVLATVWHGIEMVPGKNLDPASAKEILGECCRAFDVIGEAAEKSAAHERLPLYQSAIQKAKRGIQGLGQALQRPEAGQGPQHPEAGKSLAQPTALLPQLKQDIENLKQVILEETKIEYAILFLPYKASMWDSMESIWRSAKEDPRCSAYVAPVPYFDRSPDGSFGQMHYEGSLLPDYVELTDCSNLHLELLQPDAIYIHNPYDDCNYVTSVHPAFYSGELKKYTGLLVYVSYFIAGVYSSMETASVFCQSPGMVNADLIIAQSNVHKQLLAGNGNHPGKIAVLGSPKLDYAINHIKDAQIPEEWSAKLAGDTVFLVCSSIGLFLAWEKMMDIHSGLLDMLLNRYHAAVIYRPHPLLEATLQSMRPGQYSRFQAFLSKYKGHPKFILDKTGDFIPAAAASNCLISDYSSVCFSYEAIGKPVAMMTDGPPPADNYYFAFDYRGVSFINVQDYFDKSMDGDGALEQFVSQVMAGNDFGKETRMQILKQSGISLDGKSGDRIHKYVMDLL